MTNDGPPLLVLFDGTCGFCTRSVRFAQAHARGQGVRFEPLASAAGRAALVAHGFPADYGESVVTIENGRAYTESAAALRLARRLRWPWRALAAGRLIPRPLRDAMYRFVARHRGKLPGSTCELPKPE